jgi:fructan beta-fructosidase
VFYKGQWHLFYQHNPFGWNWENMHWGHAVSKDLFHWVEQPDAIYPWADTKGHAFSGSAVVDKKNTAGWKTGDDDVIVAALTDTDRGEVIAYSNDAARSFKMHADNPVVKHAGRDPKLVWHEGAGRWIMAVYDESEGKQWIAFHSSLDLKTWKFESRIAGFFECPDLFELPVVSTRVPQTRLWVLYAADGQYILGTFDGVTFKKVSPDGPGKHRVWYGNFYAAQSYDNAPDNRRIQIGWGQGIAFPGMPFNQQMVVPAELSLHRVGDDLRLFAAPVREIATLRKKEDAGENVKIEGGEKGAERALASGGELLDIEAEINVTDKPIITLTARGVPIIYDATKQVIVCKHVSAPLKLIDGKLRLRTLVDRGSVEVFGNGGAVALSIGVQPAADARGVTLGVKGGAIEANIKVHELRSVWP